jgi:light-regulated signal transduction histidine kinase (bacteriophytochrome)
VLLLPVTALTASAGRVSRERDYTVRATRYSDDELGDLTDRFNEMLDQVQARDSALERRAAELASLNTELEQFAYVASHDLQEPLRMVGSYLQLLEKRYGDRLDDDGRDFIAFAVDGAARMKVLINDLLAFSRIGTRGQTLRPTDLNQPLDDALANLAPVIGETGAVITRDPMPTLDADASQLMQLFQNLIGNALKFRGKEPPRVHVGAAADNGHWRLSVADNGIGVAPEYAEKIFVIFQRLWNRQEYPGTGIGLSVCKKIVERHGGRIWVESTPGQGATFRFTLHEERKPNQHAG